MMRRDILLTALAEDQFPSVIEAGGQRLVRNGTATRLYSWLRIEVYRAALYLPARSSDSASILAARTPRLVAARYSRTVSRDDAARAWAGALETPLPAPFLDWLRAVAPGGVERQLFLADAVLLEGPGRPPQRVPGAAFARSLLATWIGPQANVALRRGLLGLPA
jgi:hypothetical protein